MSIDRYILDKNGDPELCEDLLTWGKWFQDSCRILQRNQTGNGLVSTVFLGLDHGFCAPGDKNYKPVLWETMVFGGDFNGEIDRYCSKEDAIKGHLEMVERVENGIDHE